jgi:hypothetical protein
MLSCVAFEALTPVVMNLYLLEYNVVQPDENQPTFLCVQGLALLATCFMLVSCLSYCSTLKMKAVRSSETSDYTGFYSRRQNSSMINNYKGF